MKNFIVLLGMVLSSSAFATVCFSTDGKGTSPETHLLKRFDASIFGELDSEVLGYGGLLVFGNMINLPGNPQTVILEQNEKAPVAIAFHKYNNLMVEIRESCLKPASKIQAAKMKILKNKMGFKGEAQYFVLKGVR